MWGEERGTPAFEFPLSSCRKWRLEVPAFSNSAVSNSQLERSSVMNAEWGHSASWGLSAQSVIVWGLNLCVSCSYVRANRQTVESVWAKHHCFKKSITCNYRAYSNSTFAACRAFPGSTAIFISNLPSPSSLYGAKFRVSKMTWNQHILSPTGQPTTIKMYYHTLGFKGVPLLQYIKGCKESQRGKGEGKHFTWNGLKASPM